MSEQEPSLSRETYYAQAQSWAQDRDAGQRKAARIAWIIAALAVAVAVLEALALIALTPLKTLVPYTVLVDRNTGYVQALDGTHPQTLKPDAALTQALLAQYVVAREGYDVATIADQYARVSLWSAEGARRDYLALMPASNPQSPLAIYGRGGQLRVRIESVSPLAQGQALVRFVCQRRDGLQGESAPSYYVAIIQYRFVGNPQKLEDRLTNPLGFQVTSYRRDQEAPPLAQTAPQQAAPRYAAVQTSPEAAMARQPIAKAPIVTAPAGGAPAATPAGATPERRPPVITRYAPWRIPQAAPRSDQRQVPAVGEP